MRVSGKGVNTRHFKVRGYVIGSTHEVTIEAETMEDAKKEFEKMWWDGVVPTCGAVLRSVSGKEVEIREQKYDAGVLVVEKETRMFVVGRCSLCGAPNSFRVYGGKSFNSCQKCKRIISVRREKRERREGSGRGKRFTQEELDEAEVV